MLGSMQGYLVNIRHEALGDAPPKQETVYVLCTDEREANTLVRTALRLTDETIHIVRTVPDGEWRALGLKPYQVKHA
jgi:hypothetical protein